MNSTEVNTAVKQALVESVPGVVVSFIAHITFIDSDGDEAWAVIADADTSFDDHVHAADVLKRYVDMRYERKLARVIDRLEQ
jgi:hypothetical protein